MYGYVNIDRYLVRLLHFCNMKNHYCRRINFIAFYEYHVVIQGGGEMGGSILGGRGEGEGVKSSAEPEMNEGVHPGAPPPQIHL